MRRVPVMPLCNTANGWCNAPGCRRCEMAARGPAFARVIDLQDARRAAPPAKPNQKRRRAVAVVKCPHLGGPTGRRVACASCNKAEPVTMPVYACAKHTLTVIEPRQPRAADVAACRWCPDNPANHRGAAVGTSARVG